ncbi:MAG: PAS domain S-box protein, partial [Myxococcales bacterium]|nr:PAS domain S-box protein [Myxococcales bacterium]
LTLCCHDDPDGRRRGVAALTSPADAVSGAALHESEERLRSALASIAEGFTLQDRTGATIDCNARAEQILGLSRAQLLGHAPVDHGWRVIHPDGAPFRPDEYPTAVSLRTGEPCEDVVMGVYRPDGSLSWISINSQPMRRPGDAAPYAAVATFTDVTLRREHAERLRLAQEVARMGWAEWDLERDRVYLSDGLLALTGQSREDTPERFDALLELVHPDDRAQLVERLRQLGAGEVESVTFDHRTLRPEGDYGWLAVAVRVVASVEGAPTRMVAALLDIDDRKRAEQDRERLIRALEARNDALVRFNQTVSHDLKSPLMTIQGFAGFLRRDIFEGNTERMIEDIERVERAASHMVKVLDDLILLARVGDRIEPAAAVPLDALLRDVMARALVDPHQADVSIAPLPTVWGDRTRLAELFSQLIDNAIKFAIPGERPTIEIRADRAGDRVLCRIRDAGVGVDPRHHERIFEPFTRLAGASSGSGIGLAIARAIAESHHGSIRVASTLGSGATFTVDLPAAGGR